MINSTLQTNTGNDTQSPINAQSSEEVQQFNTSIQSAATEITNSTTSISTGLEQVANSAQSAANVYNEIRRWYWNQWNTDI